MEGEDDSKIKHWIDRRDRWLDIMEVGGGSADNRVNVNKQQFILYDNKLMV